MKIATYNCNGVRARQDLILGWLKKEKPDILALQEIKVANDLFPLGPFADIGYHCQVQGKKAHAGVALLSLEQPDEVFPGFRDCDETEYPRLITARCGKLHIVNTYIPQGRDPESEQFQYKLEWLSRLREFFDDEYTPRQRIIWLGDFNIAPEPIDVHNSKRIMGHVAHNPEVFEALAKFRDWGFTDLFRKFHPDEEGQFSYWDYRIPHSLESNRGWRVDHIYVTKSLAGRAKSCRYDRDARALEKPSDHTFMVAEFDL